MTVIWSDNFNRANSTTVIGSPTVGGAYTVVTGTWGINGNAAYTSASTANAHVTIAASADFEASLTHSVATATNAGLVFRWSDSSNYWVAMARTDVVYVFKMVAGVAIPVIEQSVNSASGAIVTVQAIGTRISVKRNGVVIGTAVDSFNSASTTAGLYISSSTVVRLDDVSWDNAPVAWGVTGYTGVGLTISTIGYATGDDLTPHAYLGRDTKTLDYVGAP